MDRIFRELDASGTPETWRGRWRGSFRWPPCPPFLRASYTDIFLNLQLFLSEFKNFPIHTQGIQIEFACPRASNGIRTHSWKTKTKLCAIILVYCSVKDWTRSCYGIRSSSDSKMSGFSVHMHVIEFVAVNLCFFSTLESGLKTAECVLTEALSGMKKLRIKKFPDTCGRGLNDVFLSWIQFSCNNFYPHHVSRISPLITSY